MSYVVNSIHYNPEEGVSSAEALPFGVDAQNVFYNGYSLASILDDYIQFRQQFGIHVIDPSEKEEDLAKGDARIILSPITEASV
jgi:hypothetical protein